MHTLDLAAYITYIGNAIWGWPLILFILSAGIIMTFYTKAIQIGSFIAMWKLIFVPQGQAGASAEAYITPLQALLNTLNASIGNGSLAGMATAMYAGGPGAAFWIFIMGFLGMAIRFVEVYASTTITETSATGALRGGPMIYLKKVPFGNILPTLYAFFCLFFAFIVGNGMQCNSMADSIVSITPLNHYMAGGALFLLLLYIMLGGAQRIIAFSDALAPLKVGLFFIATLIVFFYNISALGYALNLIVTAAFTPTALGSGLLGYSVQNAIRFGMARSINATEAGVGTAAILFGSTLSKDPFKSSVMSMASAFISNYLVCFMLMLVFIMSGTWNSGLEGIKMTILTYESTFGIAGGWMIAILSILFGVGCVVAYAYIGRECWSYITKGKYLSLYTVLYCVTALLGSLSRVDIVWKATDLIVAALIIINIYGLICLLPRLFKHHEHYK